MLNKIKVLDLTRVLAGPWCTQILADLGAEVVKIENPDGGDETRLAPPYFHPELDDDLSHAAECSDWSAFYVCANRGKKSVVLDISSPQGQQILQQLVKSCDVLVENFKVGNLARYGLDYASLSAINPQLIYCSVTGYGQTGPCAAQPGYDVLFQGMAGLMSTCGLPDAEPGGGPMRTMVPNTDLLTGMYACTGILAALMHRNATGEGQYIDIALLDTAIVANAYLGTAYLASGKSPARLGNSAGLVVVPSGVFNCFDGSVIIQSNPRKWPALCAALGHPEWVDDARFATLPDRLKNAKTLNTLLEAVTQTLHKADVVALLSVAGVPCSPVNNLQEALAEPQVVHRGLRQEIEVPGGGRMPVLKNPLRFSTIRLKTEAPPRLGEHTEEVLRSVGAWPLAAQDDTQPTQENA